MFVLIIGHKRHKQLSTGKFLLFYILISRQLLVAQLLSIGEEDNNNAITNMTV